MGKCFITSTAVPARCLPFYRFQKLNRLKQGSQCLKIHPEGQSRQYIFLVALFQLQLQLHFPERIRLLIVMFPTMSSNSSTNTSGRARKAQSRDSKETDGKFKSLRNGIRNIAQMDTKTSLFPNNK